MNARQFETRLNALLDERRDWQRDPQLRAAVGESDACRAIWESYVQLLDGFEQTTTPAPAVARIVACVQDDLATTATIPLHRSSPGAAVIARRWFSAAAVLIAGGLSLGWYLASPDDRNSASVRRHHSLDTAPAAVAQSPPAASPAALPNSISDKEAEGVKALVGLAHETRQAMGEVVLQLPNVPAAAPPVLGTDSSTPGRLLRDTRVMGHVSNGLAPLTNSAAGALDFLLEVLPGRDD